MIPSRHRPVFTAALALALALASASCASGPRQDPFGGAGPDEEILLTIHNRDTRNADVYAYWNGLKERLGTVVAMQSETFRTKWRSERIQLGVEFVGTMEGYRTETVDVTQGDHLDYVILGRR